MKKILAFFLCLCVLQGAAAMPVSAEKEPIYITGPIEVPYDITYFFFAHDYFRADNLVDVRRLLDLSAKIKKDYIVIQPAEEIYEETEQMLLDFAEKNVELCWEKGEVSQRGDILILDIFWRKADYDQLPVLHNAQEVYEAVQESKAHPTYDKAYSISTDYVSYDEYQNSGWDTIVQDVLEQYEEDISPYLLYGSTFRHPVHRDKYYIFASIGVTTHYEQSEKEKKEARLDQYYRAIKSSVLFPIEEDMDELEKIWILRASVGNIVRKYELTNIVDSWRSYSIGVGQCAHFAAAFRDLCEIYGVECVYVRGDVSWAEDPHAWNCVKYNGNWYMFDPQWGATNDMYDYTLDHIGLGLYNADSMKERGYIWEESEYPLCNSENIVKSGKEYVLDMDFPDTVQKYEMFEPYIAENPLSGPFIFCDVYFDPTIGKIYAIDTTLCDDTLYRDEQGNWARKEVVLNIPEEIDGVKVKSIDKNLSFWKTARDTVYTYALPSSFDKVILPDDLVIEDFAFARVSTQALVIGDRVTAGYNGVPFCRRKDENVMIGEDFTYKGEYIYPGAGMVYEKEVDYYKEFSGKEMVFYYSKKENLENDSSHPRVYYSGYGNNIVDDDPVNTLTLCKETEYIDPRLNRLNRKFVVDEENPYYCTIDGVLYSKDKTKLISVPTGTKEIEIPETVTEIGEYAFAYCIGLTEIVIPATVTKVGNRAFFHMAGLEAIYLEGQTPEGFAPQLCGDFQLVHDARASEKMPEARLTGSKLVLSNVPSGGNLFTVFYDVQRNILEIVKGKEVEVPIYAKSFETYCWDTQMRPLTYKLSQEL